MKTAFLSWLMLASSQVASRKRQLTNVTVYRLTPINYTGVANMDTGDALGDAMFGLNQLTLPQLCLTDPEFLWCGNRRYLSGGGTPMVYTEFVVESDVRFGEYNACNPDKETGIFECKTFNRNTVPRQCAAGFEVFDGDCLNGSIFSRLATSSDWNHAEAECCEACTKAGARCAGWDIGPKQPDGGRICALLEGSTTRVPSAQAQNECRAAQRDPNAFACWYSDPKFNSTFHALCDPDSCGCDAVSMLSVGREQHAMCWPPANSQSQASLALKPLENQLNKFNSKWIGYIKDLACLLNGTWYSTQAKGQCHGSAVEEDCWWRLAETHRTVNSSCVDDRMVAAVRQHRPHCWEGCPQPSNRSSACYLECLFETMLGNETKGVPPLSREQVVAPFLGSFKAEHEGGCPSVMCHSDHECRLSGDVEARCTESGSCHCSDGFFGQFCSRSQIYI